MTNKTLDMSRQEQTETNTFKAAWEHVINQNKCYKLIKYYIDMPV